MTKTYIYKQFRRDKTQGVVAGLCAGVAEYYDLHLMGVRLATVFFAFMAPGFTAFVYILASLLTKTR